MIRIPAIDDEPLVLGNLRKKISKNGFHVEAFLEAKKAVNRAETAPYDAVLTDILMPDMDAMQVLDRVKANFPQTQAIMITGYASIENALEAVKQGAFTRSKGPLPQNRLCSQSIEL